MTGLKATLKSLCFRTAWCYAVFWKLKRRSRMMLTWEDGYCKHSRPSDASSSMLPGIGWLRTGGNPLDQGGSRDLEGKISLAVAQMSYHVYSMGEGIIGRVAFTGKHQWVFNDGELTPVEPGHSLNNQLMLEKYPDGWQNQFAVGIKTIVVIAVAQGVVQLGSTEKIREDVEWVDHIKSVFGTLQAMPSECQTQTEKAVLRSADASPRAGMKKQEQAARQQGGRFSAKNFDGVTGMQPADAMNCQGKRLVSIVQGVSDVKNLKSKVEDAEAIQQESQLGQVDMHQSLQPCPSIQPFDMPSTCNQKILSSDYGRRIGWFEYSEEKELEAGYLNHGDQPSPVLTKVGNRFVASMPLILPNHSSHKQMQTLELTSLAAPADQVEDICITPKHRFSTQNKSSHCTSFSKNAFYDLLLDKKKAVNSECFSNTAQTSFTIDDSSQSEFSAQSKRNQDEALLKSVALSAVRSDQEHIEGIKHRSIGSKDASPTVLDELEKLFARLPEEHGERCDYAFAIGDELSQALGPAFRKGNEGKLDQTSVSGEIQTSAGLDNTTRASAQLTKVAVSQKRGTTVTSDNFNSGVLGAHAPESKPEFLLDAVVGNAFSNQQLSALTTAAADDSLSCRSVFSGVTSSMPATLRGDVKEVVESGSAGRTTSFMKESVQPVVDGHARKDIFSLDHVPDSIGCLNFCSSDDSSSKLALSSWSNQSFKSGSSRHSQLHKPEELGKASKKRARPGESTRPRPKDRQQIQDRVRELRDIVPDGSKCSIDALLEKTIKHMLFLQSVTLHADKLKENGELKDDAESGASWALELGSQDTGCPILVKNLTQPRQMLVEMLCEERGLFLEIADIIRSLGLTILKGFMESQTDKVYARFIVEADRDIQRVEVLLSLLQLLHLDNNNSSSSMTDHSGSIRPQQGMKLQQSSITG